MSAASHAAGLHSVAVGSTKDRCNLADFMTLWHALASVFVVTHKKRRYFSAGGCALRYVQPFNFLISMDEEALGIVGDRFAATVFACWRCSAASIGTSFLSFLLQIESQKIVSLLLSNLQLNKL